MTLDALHNPGAPLDLDLGGLALTAFSISGIATYVLAPSLDACFDLGHCPTEATRLRHVFLTHIHLDHSTGALRHLQIRAMMGMKPSRIYLPAESEPVFRALLDAAARFDGPTPPDWEPILFGVPAGGSVKLGPHRRVHAFDVVHRVASRGWTVIETRRKLRAEHVGKTREELAALRAGGATLDDTSEIPILTYIGDSTIETLRRHPEVGRSEVLFLEVTHLGSTNPSRAAFWGHTHLDELVAFWRETPEALASPHIVLKHFSTRYSRAQIAEAIAAIPEELRRRVTVLI